MQSCFETRNEYGLKYLPKYISEKLNVRERFFLEMVLTSQIILICLVLISNVSYIPRTFQFTLNHTFPDRVTSISNH